MSIFRTIRPSILLITAIAIGLLSNSIYATTDVEIIQSPNDDRQYRGVYLDNGLRVLLVSDPSAEKAGVALNVEVGSYNEPATREGLAHFLEHMLFLGTQKYPNPNEYSKFINEHGGMDNAWTGARNTQYYYAILPQYLPESLDRFAQFFIAPLFTPELVDRERHAVDSEYQLSMKKDGWRINEVSDVTANPQHPMVQFSVGNLTTLGDKNKPRPIREELVEFYQNYYSSERMVLAIVAPQSLDDLEKLVIENFSSIVQHKVKDNAIVPLAYTPNETAKKISIQTLGDYQELSMEFPIPSQKDKYQYKSVEYILYLIQQTGPDSLYQLLKNKNWISDLSANTSDVTTNQDTATISFTLTVDGLKHIDEIVKYTFNYLQFLNDVGPQKQIFDELKMAGERNFIYAQKQDPSDYVAALPMAMQHYPLAKVLIASSFTKDTIYDPEQIKSLFAYFTPHNLRMYVVNPRIVGDKFEKNYKVKYKVEKITDANQKKWIAKNNAVSFALPPPNTFLPENFALVTDREKHDLDTVPTKIVDKPGIVTWFKQDQRFKLPITNLMYLLESPNMQSTPRRALLAKFLIASFDDKLSNLQSQFALAGVNVSDDAVTQGITLNITMFSDKSSEVIKQVLYYLKDPKVNANRFGTYKDEIKRDLLNFKQQHPFAQASTILGVILKEPSWLPSDLLKEVDNITIQEVENYTKEFLENVQLQSLIHGNLVQQTAQDLTIVFADNLTIDTKRDKNPLSPKIIRIKDGTRLYYAFDPNHDDGVLVSYYQAQDTGDASVAINLLIVDVLYRPLFDQLRTKEQLGYVVGLNALRLREQAGMMFYIESPHKKPAFLQERLVNVLQNYKPQLVAMPADEFATYKSSLQSVLLQKPNSLAEESARYWVRIVEGTYRFQFEKDIAALVQDIQQQDLVTYFDSIWLNTKTQRSIAVISPDKMLGSKDITWIKSIKEFKAKATYVE